jgi:hypothetical protein
MPAEVDTRQEFRDLGDRVVLHCNSHGVAAPSRLLEPGDKTGLLSPVYCSTLLVDFVQWDFLLGSM